MGRSDDKELWRRVQMARRLLRRSTYSTVMHLLAEEFGVNNRTAERYIEMARKEAQKECAFHATAVTRDIEQLEEVVYEAWEEKKYGEVINAKRLIRHYRKDLQQYADHPTQPGNSPDDLAEILRELENEE